MSSQDPETVYRSGPPAPRQKRFPGRQRTVRHAQAATNIGLQRQQSTLTQLDFCTPSPSSFDDIEGVEDTEYASSNAGSKRRKVKKKTLRQTTMTQLYSSFDTEPSDDILDLPEETVLDSFAAYPRPVEDMERVGLVKKEHDSPRPTLQLENKTTTTDFAPILIMNTPPRTSVPQTPTKKWKDEIPSSQTPQSIMLSGRSRRSLYSPHRSPLKERSSNIQMSPRKLRDGKIFSPDKVYIASLKSPELIPASPPENAVFRKPVIRKHESNETIPDSEDKEVGVSVSPPLRRVQNTVQDSQWESLGEEILLGNRGLQVIAETQRFNIPATHYAETQLGVTDDEDGYTDEEGATYNTYDPACSALDRDAARFMQTQKLQNARRLLNSDMAWHPDTIFATVEPPHPPHSHTSQEEVDMPDDDQDDHASVSTHSIAETPDPDDADLTEIPAIPKNIETIDLTSTPQLPATSSPRPESPTHTVLIKAEPIRSSPPPIPLSQATTVDNITQIPHHGTLHSSPRPFLGRRLRSPELPSDMISSSPLPHNPSSPQAKHAPAGNERRSSFSLYTSDSLLQSAHRDDEYNGGPTQRRRMGKRLKRATEVLPDSLLDFSLPVAPVELEIDYSLPPPSSDWRNALKRRAQD